MTVLLVVSACGAGEGAPDGTSTGTVVQAISTTGAVLTQHGDAARSGLDSAEPKLTWAAVPGAFGKLFSVAVDGKVYAQPLFAPGVSIGGGTHDVVYVATEHDSVYAFDAYSGAQLWTHNLGTSVPSGDVYWSGCVNIPVEVGITGTPVIDPVHNTIFFVSATKDVFSGYHQYLNALDLTTGIHRTNSPHEITASVPGDGVMSVGGTIAFDARRENQRAGLLYDPTTNRVFIAWASHCSDALDFEPPPGNPATNGKGVYEGWLMSYDATSLSQLAVFNAARHEDTSPGNVLAYGAGIWMGAGGPAFDGSKLYVNSGNGLYDPVHGDIGDSTLAFDTSLNLLDSFTPANQAHLYAYDLDVSAAGPILVPDTTPAHASLLVTSGKEGSIFVLDRAHLGGAQPITGDVVCAAGSAPGNCAVAKDTKVLGFHSSDPSYVDYYGQPAYFNGAVYYAGREDVLKKFSVGGTGGLSPAALASTSTTFGYPGTTPSITSNGLTDGIVWALERTQANPFTFPDPTHLHAYRADTLAELWTSVTNSEDPTAPGQFVAPTTAAGQVYIGDGSALTVYGMRVGLAPAVTSVTQGSAVTLAFSSATVSPAVTYTLTTSVSPSGPTATLSPASITSGGGATLTFTAGLATTPGLYTVTVNATAGAQRYKATSQITVVRKDQLPVARFTVVCSGRTCTFNGTTSSDAEGPIAGYAWTFGDGGTATGSTVVHTYATNGTYTAALTVTDSGGQTGAVSHPVPAIDSPPFAAFTVTCNGRTCHVDAESSADDVAIAGWRWHWGDGTSTAVLTTNVADYTYAADGPYTITLDVIDTTGQTTSVSHGVTAFTPPTAAFTFSCTGLTCTFDGSGSSGIVALTHYHWDWGDETTDDHATPTATHTFLSADTFDVELIVTDANGQTGPIHHPVTVP
ncbi:MAG TPA: PKD domain-containing protein [Kofleriaceae bacterium]|jgi:PKD repeat protein